MKKALLLAGALGAAAMPGTQVASPLVSDDMLAHLQTHYSSQAYQRGVAINRLIEQLEGRDIGTQLTEINRFFNRFVYREDQTRTTGARPTTGLHRRSSSARIRVTARIS